MRHAAGSAAVAGMVDRRLNVEFPHGVDGRHGLRAATAARFFVMDAIDEVKMMTTSFDAENGRLASGTMNTMLKSGTVRQPTEGTFRSMLSVQEPVFEGLLRC
jgi:hypothetical protein